MSGRIRSIKPEVLDDAVTAGLSDSAFRLFIAAIVLADDYGRLRAEPGWLRGQVYWSRDVSSSAIGKTLEELEPLIQFYDVDGQRYAEIRNWSKHQRVDRPGKPRIPPPSESSRDSRESLAKPSCDPRETLATDLRSPNIGSGNGSGPLARLEPESKTRLKVAKPRPAGTTIPKDWTLSPALKAWASNQGIAIADATSLSDAFLDYWLQQDPSRNKGASKVDWDAAYRTWVRRAIDDGKVNAAPPSTPSPRPAPLTTEQVELRRTSASVVAAAIAEMDSRLAGGER